MIDAIDRPRSLDAMRADFWRWLRPHLAKPRHRGGLPSGTILAAWKKQRGDLMLSGAKEETRVRYIIRKLVAEGALRRTGAGYALREDDRDGV